MVRTNKNIVVFLFAFRTFFNIPYFFVFVAAISINFRIR